MLDKKKKNALLNSAAKGAEEAASSEKKRFGKKVEAKGILKYVLIFFGVLAVIVFSITRPVLHETERTYPQPTLYPPSILGDEPSVVSYYKLSHLPNEVTVADGMLIDVPKDTLYSDDRVNIYPCYGTTYLGIAKLGTEVTPTDARQMILSSVMNTNGKYSEEKGIEDDGYLYSTQCNYYGGLCTYGSPFYMIGYYFKTPSGVCHVYTFCKADGVTSEDLIDLRTVASDCVFTYRTEGTLPVDPSSDSEEESAVSDDATSKKAEQAANAGSYEILDPKTPEAEKDDTDILVKYADLTAPQQIAYMREKRMPAGTVAGKTYSYNFNLDKNFEVARIELTYENFDASIANIKITNDAGAEVYPVWGESNTSCGKIVWKISNPATGKWHIIAEDKFANPNVTAQEESEYQYAMDQMKKALSESENGGE